MNNIYKYKNNSKQVLKTEPSEPKVSYYEIKLEEIGSQPSKKMLVQLNNTQTHESIMPVRRNISNQQYRIPLNTIRVPQTRSYNDQYKDMFNQRNLIRLTGGLTQLI